MKLQNLIHILIGIVCIGLLPKGQAVVPAPDGGYAGGNTAEGTDALFNLTSGLYNTAIGQQALFHNNAGTFNTAEGFRALFTNTIGQHNTATGVNALLFNTTGNNNTANGSQALYFNTGSDNTATGAFALFSNTTGTRHTAIGSGALRNCIAPPDFEGNTAIGARALFSDTTGNFNTAIGGAALFSNIDGVVNTAIGLDALAFNTTGDENTATGGNALFTNTEGIQNTANGTFALFSNTTGGQNTGVGRNALVANVDGSSNTAIGNFALQSNISGDNNTALGVAAGSFVTTANNVICIGANGANTDDSCFIGNIYSNVQPIVGTDPDSVTITSIGRLGRGNVSSRRYKHDINPMDKASEALYALKPVSFRYNKEYDATQTLAFGLIAEEVAEVYPDLVGRNPKGEPESVRYEQINAMLLNEFLKEHHQVQDLKSIVAEQQKQIEALTAGLQKVSDQLELRKPAPQVVNNP